MAWYKRYRVPFQSFSGTQYMVYIYEHSDGDIITMTGAEEPFTTQEDNDDDIFIPIRKQTGYLRVIDDTESGNLLESIMPSNNTEKLVRLYSGTWDDEYTTFTDGTLEWQGFLCAEAFTQPWDNQKKELEFPVKSVLGALEDITMPDTIAGSSETFGRLIIQAYTAAGVQPTRVAWCSNIQDAQRLFRIKLRYAILFKQEDVVNVGESIRQYIGSSYGDALERMARFYGMFFREMGDTLYLMMYDANGKAIGGPINSRGVTWSQFNDIANATSISTNSTPIPEQYMLPALTFKGSDNVAGYIGGANSASVVLKIDTTRQSFNLPQTTEDASTVLETSVYDQRTVYTQPHAPRTHNIETFTFKKYKKYQYLSESSYNEMLEKTIINGYTATPYGYDDDNHPLVTGAFPCRWFYKKQDTDLVQLRNGLYLNQQYTQPGSVPTGRVDAQCYSLKSLSGFVIMDGWLRITLNTHDFVWFQERGLMFDDISSNISGFTLYTDLHCALRVGTSYWNGSSWVANGNPIDHQFVIKTKNGEVVTNKTSDIQVDAEGGLFVPTAGIASSNVMDVEFYILNTAVVFYNMEGSQNNPNASSYAKIIDGLEVSLYPRISATSSNRGNNTYYQRILSGGFAEDKSIELSFGTNNNNVPSLCFLTDINGYYISDLPYNGSTFGDASQIYRQRPENNLLARLVSYYNQVRRTFVAVVGSGIELMLSRYSLNGRKFLGIDAKHNWRDDIQEIKFIEVT